MHISGNQLEGFGLSVLAASLRSNFALTELDCRWECVVV